MKLNELIKHEVDVVAKFEEARARYTPDYKIFVSEPRSKARQIKKIIAALYEMRNVYVTQRLVLLTGDMEKEFMPHVMFKGTVGTLVGPFRGCYVGDDNIYKLGPSCNYLRLSELAKQPDEIYHCVYVIGAAEKLELSIDGGKTLFEEINRVLMPGGTVIVVNCTANNEIDAHLADVYRREREMVPVQYVNHNYIRYVFEKGDYRMAAMQLGMEAGTRFVHPAGVYHFVFVKLKGAVGEGGFENFVFDGNFRGALIQSMNDGKAMRANPIRELIMSNGPIATIYKLSGIRAIFKRASAEIKGEDMAEATKKLVRIVKMKENNVCVHIDELLSEYGKGAGKKRESKSKAPEILCGVMQHMVVSVKPIGLLMSRLESRFAACIDKGKGIWHTVDGGAGKLLFGDEYFDVVVVDRVLSLMGPKQMIELLNEVGRVIRKGGHLIIKDWAAQMITDSVALHYAMLYCGLLLQVEGVSDTFHYYGDLGPIMPARFSLKAKVEARGAFDRRKLHSKHIYYIYVAS